MASSRQRLPWHGVFLFGLVTGFVEQKFANPRMGSLVTLGFLSLGVAIAAASILVLWGLRKDAGGATA